MTLARCEEGMPFVVSFLVGWSSAWLFIRRCRSVKVVRSRRSPHPEQARCRWV